MPYIPKRPKRGKDPSYTLGVCPQCLGDLDYRTANGEGHHVCMQCGARRDLTAAVVRPAEAPYAQETAAAAIAPDAFLNRAPS